MKRREFLTYAGAGAASLVLPAPGAAAADARTGAGASRLAIFVYLKAGSDGYSSYVPYADPAYYKLRPTIAVPRESVIPINASLGFNRALAPLLPAWEAKELALVQGIGFPEPNQQHYPDAETLFTASETGFYQSEGWLTRALMNDAPAAGLGLHAVALGDLDIRMTDPMGPFRGDRLAVVNVQYASELLAKRRFAACQTEATTAARTAAAMRDFALPERALTTAFPVDTFGHAMRAAVEIAAAAPTLKAIHITLNADSGDHHHAFDTHWDQLKYNTPTLATLGNGLAALRRGLIEIGRWNDTLVLTLDEFGRSPVENETHGTHHGSANTQLVMGGRVKGGLIGERPELLHLFSIGGARPVIDYRALFTTVIGPWWSQDASGVFSRRYAALDLVRS